MFRGSKSKMHWSKCQHASASTLVTSASTWVTEMLSWQLLHACIHWWKGLNRCLVRPSMTGIVDSCHALWLATGFSSFYNKYKSTCSYMRQQETTVNKHNHWYTQWIYHNIKRLSITLTTSPAGLNKKLSLQKPFLFFTPPVADSANYALLAIHPGYRSAESLVWKISP